MSLRNHYVMLNLQPGASDLQIKDQYERFSAAFDVQTNLLMKRQLSTDHLNDAFQLIENAYTILRDPAKRAAYDRQHGFPPPPAVAPPMTTPSAPLW